MLKFVISKAAQSFQHFRHLSVKIVEALYLGDTLAVAVQKICVAGHRHQLCFELLIGSALRARVGYGEYFFNEKLNDIAAGIFFFSFDGAFMEAEEHRDEGRGEEVGVDHSNSNLISKIEIMVSGH